MLMARLLAISSQLPSCYSKLPMMSSERESSMVRVWIAPVIEIRNAFLRAGILTQEYDSRIGDEDAPTFAQTRATIPARRTNQIATAP
jgi:hypothetical protein